MRNPTKSPSSSSPSAAAAAVANNSSKSSSKTTPCCIKVGLKRGPWTPEEDELLSSYINKEGEGRWRTLPKRAGLLRCGKSCRLRWMNYLRPSVKRGQIDPDEEDLILRLHRLLGNRWSLIAGRIPGRTDNEIKNFWNTHLSKKLISQGIDPRTHKPLANDQDQDPNNNHNKSKAPAASSKHQKITNNRSGQNYSNPTSASSGLEEEDEVNKEVPVNIGISNGGYLHVSASELEAAAMFVHGGGPFQNGGFVNTSEEDMNNYCNEDIVFSSFLNSLINDDGGFASSSSHHQQPPPQHQNSELIPNPISAFGLGWESAITSTSTFGSEPKRANDNNQKEQL